MTDIIKPEAAKMMQIALNFRLKSDVRFASAARLQSGEIDFSYANIVTATAGSDKGGRVSIPETFTIEIPVFGGIAARKYTIEARFRYRLKEGALSIWYDLVRPHKVMRLNRSWVLNRRTGSRIRLRRRCGY